MGELTEYLTNIACRYEQIWESEAYLTPKVSIVIPAYNVEKYIEECLASLLKQTYKNFEVIIVNDGSTDLTPEIANVFNHCDNRFNLISQKNSGLSASRNRGIEMAKGEYICFIDSDDWVDENYLENLLNAIEKNNCDIAASTIVRKRKFSQKYKIHYKEEQIYSTLEDKLNVCRIPVCCYVWNKLYKASLVKTHKFEEGVYYEDVLWTPAILKDADKLVTVPNTNYYYGARRNSIVKKIQSKEKQYDHYSSQKFILKFLKDNGLAISKKNEHITKKIKYFCGIPILKIKEYRNTLSYKLFGVLPIYKKKINKELVYKNSRRMFFINDLDAHFNIELFKKIKIQIKNGKKFDLKQVDKCGINKTDNSPKLIVSLTSYPERVIYVSKTISTLLNQTIKPNRLILWLADSQFPNKEQDLPEDLLCLKQYGLEIKWCEDLKSYKKLVPALLEFPNDIIVTADDDLYYQEDWLESLYNEYKKNPECICTRRASRVHLKNNVLNIVSHYSNKYYKPTYLCQLMGGAGTLYPPNSLHPDVTNVEKIKSLIPTHDDIYFWIMALANNTKIKLVKNKDVNLIAVKGTQSTGLCKKNNKNGSGMSPLDAYKIMLSNYPEVYEKIEKESF